jgi:hypothetical protein
LVIHLGDDKWMVMDSCVNPATGQSSALECLGSYGVNCADDVVLVVASHWHDDHVRGLSQVVDACKSARFVCSAALGGDQFLALVNEPDLPKSKFTKGVEEMQKTIALLAARNSPPTFASSSKLILRSPSSRVSAIWALSPGDEDIDRALGEFANWTVSSLGGTLTRVPSWNQNRSSVVILIEVDDGGNVLLGADLEHARSSPGAGWHGVLLDQTRPDAKSTLLKVPHHGSAGAHCDRMWGLDCHDDVAECSSLVERKQATSIVAPWRLGGNSVPQPTDMDRLASLSSSVHLTATLKEAFGDPARVSRFGAASQSRSIAPLNQRPGSVTCRRSSGDNDWSVSGGALTL